MEHNSSTESAPAVMTAQQRFDRMYISSSEICRELEITRATIVTGRRRGLLPDPIMLNDVQLFIWERTTVRPFIDAWKIMLDARRGKLRA